MSAFEAVATAVGELVAYGISRIIGKTFQIAPERARKIGEYIFLGLMLGAMFLVTLVYS